MYNALKELMRPEFEADLEAELDKRVRSIQEETDKRVRSIQEETDKRVRSMQEESTLKAIKCLMKKLKYSAEQAMELLDIPVKEQSKYLRML